MTSQDKQDTLHTFAICCCGIIAYIITNVSHEAIGHGLTSVILGNQITLLSSAYFRSWPHSFITDALGPIMNLVMGLVFFIIINRTSTRNLYFKLIMLLSMAFNLFCFSWLCFYAGVTGSGDLAFDVSGLMTFFTWRGILIATGLITYYLSFILVLQSSRTIFSDADSLYSRKFLSQLFLTPYFAAGIAAWIAVSFFRPVSFTNYYETFVIPIFAPLLFVPGYLKAQRLATDTFGASQEFKWKLVGFILAVFILFCLTMGRGMEF
ncbi:MAG: hypothetical protein V4721_17915 [Bacteroidota bacterium]